jgi:hypothetical protein
MHTLQDCIFVCNQRDFDIFIEKIGPALLECECELSASGTSAAHNNFRRRSRI